MEMTAPSAPPSSAAMLPPVNEVDRTIRAASISEPLDVVARVAIAAE